ncbi:unnamed protein product [Linum trigynum]|uniref:Uncharacterized protein n=1 Tax=Linum trigynum TaxID=586398 RepID=A0AAV2FAP5_9ROSI
MLPSASAIVSAVRQDSTSAVELEQRFHFRRIVHPESILSVYVRTSWELRDGPMGVAAGSFSSKNRFRRRESC